MSKNNGTSKNFEEFSDFVEEFQREVENDVPAEKEIVALARVERSIDAEKLRQSVVENSHLLPLETSEQFNAIILNKNFGSYIYRIGLLRDLDINEKRRLSRHLDTYSVSSIKFVVLEPMVFEMLKREAYEVRNLTRAETRKNQQQTRSERVWGGGKTIAESSVRSEKRLDISNLKNYYEMLKKMESEDFDENELDTFSFVTFLFQDFILSGGSDLHLHSARLYGRIRYRYQGTLYTRFSNIPLSRFREIVSSICSLAGKDAGRMSREVVESVVPLTINLEGKIKDVEFRFESLPTLHCPSVNLRGQTKPLRDINKVGFVSEQLSDIEEATSKDRGIVVVTGPTGSGKTNTLNAIFAQLEEQDDKAILELGSPVEIESDRRVQLTLPDGLTERTADIIYQKMFKACMRFDPDVIAFTEIRSSDEARIAFRAATTGHLVFTTLHAADVEETFGTVFGWHIDRSIVAKGIHAIVAQTLIQKLCENCKIEDSVASQLAGSQVFRENEAGCSECDAGYAGRTVVAEVLYFNDDVRQMIIQGCKPDEIVAKSIERGYMIPMKEIARRKLIAGVTSESEVVQLVELRTELNAESEVYNAVVEDEERYTLPVKEAEFEDVAIN